MKKVIKVIVIVLAVLLFLFFGLLTFNYCYNEFTISKYDEHDYSKNDDLLTHTSIFETYIAHYNNGNIHYQCGEYEQAIEDYKQALEVGAPHEGEECDIRVNLALAIIGTLPENYSAPENIEQSIQTLEEARDYLLEEECALDEGEGHDDEAQQLKEEIDKLIEQLKQQQSGGGSDNPDEPKDDENQTGGTGDDREEEIKEQLQDIQEESHQEREEELQMNEEVNTNTGHGFGGEIW